MTREEGMRTPTPLPSIRALPEDVGVQGAVSGQGAGSQRQAGPQGVQHGLPPAVQELPGHGGVREVSGGRGVATEEGRSPQGGRQGDCGWTPGKGAKGEPRRGEGGGSTARKGGACAGGAQSREHVGGRETRVGGIRNRRKQDVGRIHLWIQLAEGRARPAEQTQLQARQQRQGQEAVRDLNPGREVSLGPESSEQALLLRHRP